MFLWTFASWTMWVLLQIINIFVLLMAQPVVFSFVSLHTLLQHLAIFCTLLTMSSSWLLFLYKCCPIVSGLRLIEALLVIGGFKAILKNLSWKWLGSSNCINLMVYNILHHMVLLPCLWRHIVNIANILNSYSWIFWYKKLCVKAIINIGNNSY